MIRSSLLLLTLMACGPRETNFRNLTAEIAVSPPEVDFGEVGIFTDAEQVVFINNAGRAKLEATFSIEGNGPFSLPVAGTDVGADDVFTLPITFSPETALDYAVTLVIESNDKTDGRVEVPLTGVGADLPLPDICFDSEPMVIDWGTVPAGDSDFELLYVHNCGRAPLELGVLDQQGSGAFRVDAGSDPSNEVIAPDGSLTIPIFYEPPNDGGDSGTLTFPSNDPDQPEVSVTLLGNGGGPDVDYPVALIDCPPTSAPPQVVVLDGSGSYDPGGFEPLQYLWTLMAKPDGSSSTLSEYILDTTSVFTDLGGQYEIQLQVANTQGLLSAPERCFIDAIPADDIHVELTWDTTGVDLDLHLLQNTTAELYDTPDDCNWCNKNPSWGAAGTGDDPRLDLDDRSDGPENANILAPANGAYPVAVHYYDPLGGPATTATVRVFTNGVEVYSGDKVIQRNDVWMVGQINWPDGSFGVYSDPLFTATRRQCQ